MPREYADYLRDFLDAIEKVQTFIKDLEFEDFKKDDETVWLTAKEKISQLKPSIDKILSEIKNAKDR